MSIKRLSFVLGVLVLGILLGAPGGFRILSQYKNYSVGEKKVEEKGTQSVASPKQKSIAAAVILLGGDPEKRLEARVARVIDGDTVDVALSGEVVRVRVIGINTPETVDPRKPVECFGREASERAKALLTGQLISLQSDPSQDRVDKYGRLLAYLFLQDGTNFGKRMIEEGYAHEYTYHLPYRYQKEFKQAEKEARQALRGLWAPGVCSS